MGLGRSLALELASRGHNLILTSLPSEDLADVIKECKNHNVNCIGYEVNLSRKDELMEFIANINSKYEIFILINNAGIGGSNSFDEASINYIEDIINLNVMATTMLTHQLLPNLKRQEKAYILNISSMASLIPSGYKTIYPASKAFIRHFSLGLSEELRDTNINVCVAILGPMATSREVSDRINSQGILGKLLTAPVEKVARKSIARLLRGKHEVVVGFSNALSKLIIEPLFVKIITHTVTKRVKNNEIP